MQESRSPFDLEQSHAELHDLCQPLTALQCRLELTRLPGHSEPLEVAIEESLQEMRRLFAVVERMRERLLLLDPDGRDVEYAHSKCGRRTGEDHGNRKY